MAEQRDPGGMSNGVIANGDSRSITADPEHTELLTALIVRRTFNLLLQDGGISRDDLLKQFTVDLQRMDRDDAKVVSLVTDSLREVLQTAEYTTVPAMVRDFEGRDWPLSEEIICTEFHRVAKELIEETNWGRMITFLLFSVSFSIFALRQGMPDATVLSIHGWTVEALRSTPTSTFIVTHDGWVSGSGGRVPCRNYNFGVGVLLHFSVLGIEGNQYRVARS